MRYAIISGLSVIASAAVSFFMEPLIPLGDWRWLVIASIGLLVAWFLWLTDPNRRRQALTISADGREVARKIGRLRKRHRDRVDELYLAYKAIPPGDKQFSERAAYAYWNWLNAHYPERATQFARENLGIAHEGWQESMMDPFAEPWWKRAWASLRW